ncbi:nucleoside-diphosphate kinase [Tsukamurella sp. 1534]|uniref:nucleoside-diphosphate kinase n=1 Tax=Tsukamurella sp. 1534 TaxID=1151061 RepID=UPI0006ACA506|nr:nucleoside-diphosphate kinase [Tsukamurella sp. 1534]
MLTRLNRSAADVDTYVIESVGQLRARGIDPVDFAERHTMLLLKPDAILARAVEPTLEWLARNGYRVAHAERITADRHLARAMWRSSWITASAERRRLADLLVGVCDALVLVVAADHEQAEPVPVRLTREKGATDPRGRSPGDLRHALGIHSHLLNLVHTPDDPFDVLRELAILFDETVRARVVAAVQAADPRADGAALARELAGALYADAPARSFERDEAHRRVAADLAAAGAALPDPPGGADRRDQDAAAAELLRRVWAEGVDADPWSVVVLGSHVLPLSAPNPLHDTTNSDAAIPRSRTGGSHDDQ